MITSGYYAPLSATNFFHIGAWDLTVGTTPDGKWVVEYVSTAAPRPQREYYDTQAEAVEVAKKFCKVAS